MGAVSFGIAGKQQKIVNDCCLLLNVVNSQTCSDKFLENVQAMWACLSKQFTVAEQGFYGEI